MMTFGLRENRNRIVRPITDDGMVGYDQFDQLIAVIEEEDGRSTRFVADVRGKICVLCGGGWQMAARSFVDQEVVRDMKKMAHASCLARHRAFNEFFTVRNALCHAILFEDLEEVPNPYWAGKRLSYRTAALVEEPGRDIEVRFTVGMRKRVWSVEVELVRGDRPFPKDELKAAFETEDVTKEFEASSVCVHAWTEASLVQYLEKIARVLGVDRKTQLEARYYGRTP